MSKAITRADNVSLSDFIKSIGPEHISDMEYNKALIKGDFNDIEYNINGINELKNSLSNEQSKTLEQINKIENLLKTLQAKFSKAIKSTIDNNLLKTLRASKDNTYKQIKNIIKDSNSDDLINFYEAYIYVELI